MVIVRAYAAEHHGYATRPRLTLAGERCARSRGPGGAEHRGDDAARSSQTPLVAEQAGVIRRRRSPVLWGRIDRRAELGGGLPWPVRVVEHRAGERDHVGLTGRDDRLGLGGVVIADRDRAYPGRAPDRLGNGT
jgi:hypothetical protein